jgi:hypothetical protein
MAESQRLELESILNAAAARRRPVLQYHRMSTEKFVLIWHYLICVKSFSFGIVSWGASSNGVCVPDAEWDEFESGSLTRSLILKLSEWCYIPRLFAVLGSACWRSRTPSRH